jgi:lipopolysaccharide transport system permease protein
MEEQVWMVEVRADAKTNFNLKELLKCKDLILLWFRREFVAKYKQTILGPAWAIIQPFLTTVVYSIFFGNVAGLGAAGVPNFIFYLSGNIIWGLFAGSINANANTFIHNAGVFSKVYFPRLVMPIASMISQFVSFLIQFVFMIGFLIYYVVVDAGVMPTLFALMTPVFMLQLAMLGMGMGIIISSLTTKYRDLQMLVGFGVSLLSYMSPVAYDMFSRSALAPGGVIYKIYMLNPVTPAVMAMRYAFLGTGYFNLKYYLISWVVTIVVLFFGVVLFSRIEKTFADTV